ncbi:MAG TPA: SpoIIE family protein phosphatase [Polyangiaceae bacterium]
MTADGATASDPSAAGFVRPFFGEAVSGDATFVRRAQGHWQLAVIDGLGHGAAAAAAASAVCVELERHDWNDLVDLTRRCDAAARGTRGVALTLVRVEQDTGACQHVAVGNVEVVAGNAARRIAPLTRPGIVGAGVRQARITRFMLERGDVLVIHSDGISGRFDLEQIAGTSATETAEALVADYGKPHDDAGCVVLYYDDA